MKVRKTLRIPGPPGLADDAAVPNHADSAVENGASAAWSGKQLQELLEALLHEKAQGKAQVVPEDTEQLAFQDEHSPMDSSKAEDPTSLKKMHNLVVHIG